jgi:hypothetical protein
VDLVQELVMARPVGEVRQALQKVYDEAGAAGLTVRQAAHLAVVGLKAAQQTVENMVRAQILEPVGRLKPAGSSHWEQVYAPVEAEAPDDSLASVMRTFPAQAVEA